MRANSVTCGSILGPSTVYINSATAFPNGSGRLQIYGTASSASNSPSILLGLNSDNYPALNIMPYTP